MTESKLNTKRLDGKHKVQEGVAGVIAGAVWNKSQDVRDCIKIGKIAKSTQDVEFIVEKFFGPKIS